MFKILPPLIQNYFCALSSWTANFGVVPLLTLAAFLLAPALTLFLDLLFFVTRVFETIFILPTGYFSHQLLFFIRKCFYVPKLSQTVKVYSTVFLVLCSLNTYAKSKTPKIMISEIILAKGQLTEITGIKLDHYTIGNKEVISHKFDSKNKKIIIRAKMLGFSDVLIWKKGKKTHLIKVYVFSKKEQLGLLNMAKSINNLGLKATVKGPVINILGHLEDLEVYKLYRKIIQGNLKKIHQQITFALELKNNIIGEVYYLFYNEYIDDIYCRTRPAAIHCFYSAERTPNKLSLKRLKEEYGVEFFTFSSKNQSKNYRVKLKLVQLEKLNGEELNFGLDKLDTALGDIIDKGVLGVARANRIYLNNLDIQMSTLAEPTALLGLNRPLLIKIGDDIPFKTENKDRVIKTTWKFAGLKILIHLYKRGNIFELKYTTILKKPGSENKISGSEERSSVYIKPGIPIELFSIGYRTVKESNSRFPLLSKIPLLGNLFISKGRGDNYKKITGVIVLEKMEE